MSEIKKLHIGFITMEFPHPSTGSSGGLGTSIKHLTRALTDEGHKVSVFIIYQDKDEVIDDRGVALHKIKHKSFKAFNWLLYRIHVNKRINLICKDQRIDILEAPDWTGVTAFMKFNIPVVIRFHGSDTYFCHLEKRPQKWKNRFLESRALKMADAYIAPTQFAATETQRLFKIDKKEIKTIHYGLSLNDFVNNDPSSFIPNTILYIGTIIRKKGVLDLALIFNLLIEMNSQARLVLVGADSDDIQTGSISTYKLFEELLSPKAISNVRYLGKVPYTEVRNCIKDSQVCVFPSFAETLGMVTIESMAMQKAVVNTSIGWAKSLIDDGENGYLIHPTHHKEYAERINSLLNDIPKCISIGKSARLKVNREFDMKTQAKKNVQFYKQQIG